MRAEHAEMQAKNQNLENSIKRLHSLLDEQREDYTKQSKTLVRDLETRIETQLESHNDNLMRIKETLTMDCKDIKAQLSFLTNQLRNASQAATEHSNKVFEEYVCTARNNFETLQQRIDSLDSFAKEKVQELSLSTEKLVGDVSNCRAYVEHLSLKFKVSESNTQSAAGYPGGLPSSQSILPSQAFETGGPVEMVHILNKSMSKPAPPKTSPPAENVSQTVRSESQTKSGRGTQISPKQQQQVEKLKTAGFDIDTAVEGVLEAAKAAEPKADRISIKCAHCKKNVLQDEKMNHEKHCHMRPQVHRIDRS